MLKVVASAMLLVLFTLVSVDKLYCVDGCCSEDSLQTFAHHGGQATHDHARPSCVFCTLGIEVVQLPAALASFDAIGAALLLATPLLRSVPGPLVDRPPRPAAI